MEIFMKIEIVHLPSSSIKGPHLHFTAQLETDDGRILRSQTDRKTPGAAIGDLIIQHPELFGIREISGIAKKLLSR